MITPAEVRGESDIVDGLDDVRDCFGPRPASAIFGILVNKDFAACCSISVVATDSDHWRVESKIKGPLIMKLSAVINYLLS